ncbi:MAG: hypothetical protein WCT37_03900 [Patescibacteria group bacterium]|jgi:hypothetical protein
MLKTTKILVIVAVVLAIAMIGLSIFSYFSAQSTRAEQEISRQEIYNKYFATLSLVNIELTAKTKPQVTWQLQDDAPTATKIALKVLDTQKGIFISQTVAAALGKTTQADFVHPNAVGQYELWVYLAEVDDQQVLAAVLPFTVK